MDNEPRIKLYSITLDAKDPLELAKFYAALLKWDIVPIQGDEYTIIAPPGTVIGQYPGITFQRNPGYTPPVWPDKPEAQQQMAHMDFIIEDIEKSVEYAVSCGAKVAEEQFSEHWTVMFDPAGHPFCLCKGKKFLRARGSGCGKDWNKGIARKAGCVRRGTWFVGRGFQTRRSWHSPQVLARPGGRALR
jgi:predicted enzyme related to lactoylglutathione lyase